MCVLVFLSSLKDYAEVLDWNQKSYSFCLHEKIFSYMLLQLYTSAVMYGIYAVLTINEKLIKVFRFK